MKTGFFCGFIVVLCGLSVAAGAVDDTSPSSAAGVFEQLQTLEGMWIGSAVGEGAAAGAEQRTTHEFRTTAAGSVVMEIMGRGTEHEMINMYHLDGEDLIVTHYCAGGNQPLMRLDRSQLEKGRVEFGFAGGTNLDAARDGHIHSASFTKLEADHIESRWTSWSSGQEVGAMTFHLERQP